MLADDLIAASGGKDDELYQGAFTNLARAVRGAHRFDLTPEVMMSAYTITHSPIGPQLRALSLCRLPFARTWFEWPGGFAGVESTRTDVHAPTPKRMGALVEAEESLQRGLITFAWVHANGRPNVCPLSITFDWTPDPQPLEDLTKAARWHLNKSEEEWRELAAKFPRVAMSKREDVVADNFRFGVIYNPMTLKFLEAVEGAGMGLSNLLLNAAIKDVEGEGPLLRSALMLMNSRNLAVAEARPVPVRLNRARAKSGKPPLLDYTLIRIKLSRGLAERAGMASDPRAPSRLHLVRGHFKVRSSGVYWWSPHARGDARHGAVKDQVRKVVR